MTRQNAPCRCIENDPEWELNFVGHDVDTQHPVSDCVCTLCSIPGAIEQAKSFADAKRIAPERCSARFPYSRCDVQCWLDENHEDACRAISPNFERGLGEYTWPTGSQAVAL